MRSVRKSLFGKVSTSVAQQQARKIVGRSTGRSAPIWKHPSKVKVNRGPEDNAGEKRGRKRKLSEEAGKDRVGKDKVAKKLMSGENKSGRRVSTRLRDLAQTTTGRKTRLDYGKVRKSGSGKQNYEPKGQSAGPKKKEEKLEPVVKKKVVSTATERGPYKIRPVERVRTRGYSLLLASKQALKRAKKESVILKQKTTSDSLTGGGKGSRSELEIQRDSSGRIKSVGDRKLSAPTVKGNASTGDSSQMKQGERTKVAEAHNATESTIVTRHSKDGQEKARTYTKGLFHKRAKALSQSTSGSPEPHRVSLISSVPTFHPTEEEFIDPLSYISKIQAVAEPYGMCKIIPPSSWKLESTKINEDVRFASQVQHIHRLSQRWGPNVQHSAAINQHLLSEMSNVSITPQIGGVEIDLPQLYYLVEDAGGPHKMADKKKQWAKIADIMNIPKQAMDRTKRVYDIYCRHVFPYATLSEDEKAQLEEEVKAIHQLQTVEDDAVIKGKSMPISRFIRIARNVQSMWFKEDPSPIQVESEYWRIVEERSRHVAVQCGHINTRAQASAFPTRRDSIYSRHAWNLNNVPENSKCILKYLGPVSGITIPTLHLGMLFSTSCWSTDLHYLPYIQYLHAGAELIWYCIPKTEELKFHSVMKDMVPTLVTGSPCWLKEDCVMVSPSLLQEKDLKVGRCVQKSRQFVVVFPGAYTATISCGYSVAESVHFATTSWLTLGMEASLALTSSGEKELFSLSSLLSGLVQDGNVDAATLAQALPIFAAVISREIELKNQLAAAGLVEEKSDVFIETAPTSSSVRKRSGGQEEEKICEVCDKVCYLSMVLNEQDEQVLCLEHGIKHVHRKKNVKSTRLFVRYNQMELEKLVKEAKDKLNGHNSQPDSLSLSQGSSKPTRTNSK